MNTNLLVKSFIADLRRDCTENTAKSLAVKNLPSGVGLSEDLVCFVHTLPQDVAINLRSHVVRVHQRCSIGIAISLLDRAFRSSKHADNGGHNIVPLGTRVRFSVF